MAFVDLDSAAKSRQWQEKRASKKVARRAKKDAARNERIGRKLYGDILNMQFTGKRYALSVPPSRYDTAKAAGCQWDAKNRFWYIDNPERIADFSAWRPVLLNIGKAPLAEYAQSQRLDYDSSEKAQSAPHAPAEQVAGQTPADAASELRA